MTSGANNEGPRVGIFIRSFDGDAKWLERTLPTHVEFCRGFQGIVVAGIERECARVMEICAANGVPFIADPLAHMITAGYINQQYTKLTADHHVDWDWILFVDSDTPCTRATTPGEQFEGDRGVMLYSEWDHVGDANCWFEPTRKALGFGPPYEFMRRLPILHHRDTLEAACRWIKGMHRRSLLDYLAGVDTISEFNLLGAVAWEQLRDRYRWICPEREPCPTGAWRQFWSHGPMEEQLKDAGA
jgi:hypothetical protein